MGASLATQGLTAAAHQHLYAVTGSFKLIILKLRR